MRFWSMLLLLALTPFAIANSLITHLGSTQVKKGQAVTQGFVLGSATPDVPAIGVELRKNGRVTDIATILG